MIGQRDCTTQYDLLPQIVTDDDEDDANQRLNTEPEKMSKTRKVAFVSSILFACLVAAAFLWLLPCPHSLSPCSHRDSDKSANEWTNTFKFTVFSSGLQLVITDGIVGFLLALKSPFNRSTKKGGYGLPGATGVVFIRASDGHKLWHENYHGEPTDFFCGRLDVNRDGVHECIVIGTLGFFAAVNVSDGYTFWYLRDHLTEPFRPASVSLPAIIFDQSEDEVHDMVVSCLLSGHGHWHLVLVSVSMGQLLGRPVPLPGCSTASFPIVIGKKTVLIHCVSIENNELPTSWVAAMNVSYLRNATMDPVNVTDKERHKEVDNVYTFKGHSDRFCLETVDLDGDGAEDVLVGGGDGEVVALGQTLNVMWTFQHGGHEIVNCAVIGQLVVITFLPVNASRGSINSVVLALKPSNGERLWSLSDHSVLSSTVVDGKFWPNSMVYKSLSRVEKRETENSEQVEKMNVMEKMLIVNANGEITKELIIRKNISVCSSKEKKFAECLPESSFFTSSIVGDLDSDGSPEMLSVMTSLNDSESDWIFETEIVKRSVR